VAPPRLTSQNLTGRPGTHAARRVVVPAGTASTFSRRPICHIPLASYCQSSSFPAPATCSYTLSLPLAFVLLRRHSSRTTGRRGNLDSSRRQGVVLLPTSKKCLTSASCKHRSIERATVTTGSAPCVSRSAGRTRVGTYVRSGQLSNCVAVHPTPRSSREISCPKKRYLGVGCHYGDTI
jgi:hypothetical protein